MGYPQQVLNNYDNTVDDEYERQLLHRSSTVTFYAAMWLSFVGGAVLAWALPGNSALWSALLLFIPAAAQAIGTRWLRRHVPAPRFAKLSTGEWFALVVILAIWLTGLTVNVWDSSLPAATGALVGAIIGGGLAVFLGPRITRWRRNRDTAKLDATLDD